MVSFFSPKVCRWRHFRIIFTNSKKLWNWVNKSWNKKSSIFVIVASHKPDIGEGAMKTSTLSKCWMEYVQNCLKVLIMCQLVGRHFELLMGDCQWLLMGDWLFFMIVQLLPFSKTPLGSGQPTMTAIVHYLSPLISRITFSHLGSLEWPPSTSSTLGHPPHPFGASLFHFGVLRPEQGHLRFERRRSGIPIFNEWLTNKFPRTSILDVKIIDGMGINQVPITITNVVLGRSKDDHIIG